METIVNNLKEELRYLSELAKFHKVKLKIELDMLKNNDQADDLEKKLKESRDKINAFIDKVSYIKKSIREAAASSGEFDRRRYGFMVTDATKEELKIREKLDQIDGEIFEFIENPHVKAQGLQKYSRRGLFAIKDAILSADELDMPYGNKNHLIEYMGDKLDYFINLDKMISYKKYGKRIDEYGINNL